MAVTADTVQVVLQADTGHYLRELKRADAAFVQLVQRAEREARQAGGAFSILGDQAQRAANAVLGAGGRITAAQSSFSGIAAQFQDIGVTAAMGMNPLLIALQQGTQLSAQLQVSAQNGQSVFRSLATGIAGLINPISIATIATVALGTAAVQYFTTLITDGQVSEEVLKRQESAIRDIADRWGEAVPALQAVVAEMDRLEGEQQQVDAFDLARSLNLEQARAEVENLNSWVFELAGELEAAGGNRNQIEQLTSAFADLRDSVRDGTVTTEQLDRATAALAVVQMTQGIPALERFSGAFTSFAAVVRQAAGAIRELNAEQEAVDTGAAIDAAFSDYISQQSELNSLTSEQLALYNEMNRVRSELGRLGAEEVATEDQIKTIAEERLAAEKRRREEAASLRPGGGGSSGPSQADREAEAVLTLIDNLEYELDLLGMTNREQAISNALRQAGAAATSEQIAEIERLTGAIYDTREAQAQLDKASREWADNMKSATRGFIDDLLEGKDAAEAFGNVLRNIGNQLINMGLNSLFSPAGFGGLFGGFRANGGPVSSGRSYIVGERGPELFTPSSGGRIIANHDLGGGGANVTFAPQIDARGADVAAVARLEEVIIRQQAEFDNRVKSIVRGANRNWRA